MAIAPMSDVVDTADELVHWTRESVALAHCERDSLEVEGTLDEYSYRAGHCKPETVEKLFRLLLGLVVDPEVDLRHDNFSSLRLRTALYHTVLPMSIRCYTFSPIVVYLSFTFATDTRFTSRTENCYTCYTIVQLQENTCLTRLRNECCVGYWKAGVVKGRQER